MLVPTAKISRGNSGGPLVDQCGRIVGINSAITRADDGDSPFAFAISVSEIARFLADARQDYHSVGTPCLSLAEAAERDRAATDAAERAEAEATAEKQTKAQFDRERDQQRANAPAHSSRGNSLAPHGLFFLNRALG